MNYTLRVMEEIFGPKGKRKPKKDLLFFCRYKNARIIFKKSGVFLGLIMIYVFTIGRFFENRFGRYEVSEEEKRKHLYNQFHKIASITHGT